MFGRVRAAPCSLDRPPSKQMKDDALSIYEITLQKLRLGSRRALQSSNADAQNSNGPCSPASSPSSSIEQSVESLTDGMEESS